MPNLFSQVFGIAPASTSTQLRDLSSAGITHIPDVEAAFLKLMGIDQTRIRVTSRTAMGISTFYSAVNLISDVIASQPYSVKQKLDDGTRKSASNHRLHYLIHTRPNARMSSFVFRKAMWMNVLVHGYAIAQIVKDGLGYPIALIPYPTKDVQRYEDPLYGDIYYKIVNRPGVVLTQEDVIELKDVAFEGGKGVAITDYQSQTIKLTALAQQFATKNFEKGAFIAGFVTAPLQGKDGDTADIYKKRIVDSLKGDQFGGFGLAVLGQGADYKPVASSFGDSKSLEVFNQSDKDIAKMFRTPPVMLGETEKSTSFGKGIDSLYVIFTNNVIIPKTIQMEQEVDYKCFTVRDQKAGYYTRVNLRNLLRGDAATYAEYATKMVQNGIYTINELRDFDEMAPVEGGDRNWIQQNMMPIDRADEILDNKENGGENTNADGNKVSADALAEG